MTPPLTTGFALEQRSLALVHRIKDKTGSLSTAWKLKQLPCKLRHVLANISSA